MTCTTGTPRTHRSYSTRRLPDSRASWWLLPTATGSSTYWIASAARTSSAGLTRKSRGRRRWTPTDAPSCCRTPSRRLREIASARAAPAGPTGIRPRIVRVRIWFISSATSSATRSCRMKSSSRPIRPAGRSSAAHSLRFPKNDRRAPCVPWIRKQEPCGGRSKSTPTRGPACFRPPVDWCSPATVRAISSRSMRIPAATCGTSNSARRFTPPR